MFAACTTQIKRTVPTIVRSLTSDVNDLSPKAKQESERPLKLPIILFGGAHDRLG